MSGKSHYPVKEDVIFLVWMGGVEVELQQQVTDLTPRPRLQDVVQHRPQVGLDVNLHHVQNFLEYTGGCQAMLVTIFTPSRTF